MKTDVAKAESSPCDKASNCTQVEQPCESLRGTARTETYGNVSVVIGQGAESDILRYARGPKSHAAKTATHGTPFLVVLPKI